MKRIIIAILLLFLIHNLQAQEIEYFKDAQNTDFSRNTNVNFSYDTIMNFSAQQKYTFKVFIHERTSRLGECNYLKGIKYLNSKYNRFNIFFKYVGYDNDDSNTHNDMIDIVLKPYSTGGSANSIDNCQIGDIAFDFDSSFIHTSTIAHEIAHLFGVNHTFTGTFSTSAQTLTNPVTCANGSIRTFAYFPTLTSFSENVTRDENNPNYNARSTGDMITDTPAMQPHSNICLDNINHVATFINIPEIIDAVGDIYKDPNNKGTENIMSYSPAAYRYSFTNGQGVRMRELAPYNTCQTTLCDIKELYKPYYSEIEVDMDNNHIASIEDDRDHPGYEIVCRPQYFAHKFQIGFEYHIYKVNNGYYFNGDVVNPADTTLQEIIPADADCDVTVIGARLAVKIPSLSDDIIMFEDLPGIRGYYCSSEQVTTTVIYSTKDLGSGNGTIKELDTQESANPELENNLEEQKYHNIKKTTTTGAQKNKTIYKN